MQSTYSTPFSQWTLDLTEYQQPPGLGFSASENLVYVFFFFLHFILHHSLCTCNNTHFEGSEMMMSYLSFVTLRAESLDLLLASQGASCDLLSLFNQCRLLALYFSHLLHLR